MTDSDPRMTGRWDFARRCWVNVNPFPRFRLFRRPTVPPTRYTIEPWQRAHLQSLLDAPGPTDLGSGLRKRQRCQSCSHWTPAGRCTRVDISGPNARPGPTIEVNDFRYDYAAFYTPSGFGCVLHEPMTSEETP